MRDFFARRTPSGRLFFDSFRVCAQFFFPASNARHRARPSAASRHRSRRPTLRRASRCVDATARSLRCSSCSARSVRQPSIAGACARAIRKHLADITRKTNRLNDARDASSVRWPSCVLETHASTACARSSLRRRNRLVETCRESIAMRLSSAIRAACCFVRDAARSSLRHRVARSLLRAAPLEPTD